MHDGPPTSRACERAEMSGTSKCPFLDGIPSGGLIFVGVFLYHRSDYASDPGVIPLVQVRQRDSRRRVRCSEPPARQQDDATLFGQSKQNLERVLVAQRPVDEVASVAPGAEDFEIKNCIIVDRIRIL